MNAGEIFDLIRNQKIKIICTGYASRTDSADRRNESNAGGQGLLNHEVSRRRAHEVARIIREMVGQCTPAVPGCGCLTDEIAGNVPADARPAEEARRMGPGGDWQARRVECSIPEADVLKAMQEARREPPKLTPLAGVANGARR